VCVCMFVSCACEASDSSNLSVEVFVKMRGNFFPMPLVLTGLHVDYMD